jgi:hypothetical protein
MRVTDPRTGLPSTSQWLPTVKEIRDACDVIVRVEARRAKRDRDLRAQMRDRDKFDAEQKAKSNRPAGLVAPTRVQQATEPEKFKRHYGLSDREFAALPDQSPDFMNLPTMRRM